MKHHRPEVVDQAIAQVRKWQSSPNDGWAPSRLQAGVLADEVERLRTELDNRYSDGFNAGRESAAEEVESASVDR